MGEGEQKRFGNEPEEVGSIARGSYSYELEGVTYTVNWVADENGFQPTGAHLPVAPPMPEYVVKMLADLRAAGKTRIDYCTHKSFTSYVNMTFPSDYEILDQKSIFRYNIITYSFFIPFDSSMFNV